jgi:hypothetical protein
METKRRVLYGVLLVGVGVGCAMYAYSIHAREPRGRLALLNGRELSSQENLDLLKRLERAGYDVADYRRQAERDADKMRVTRNVKVGISVAAALGCGLPGIILVVTSMLAHKSKARAVQECDDVASGGEGPS